MRSDLFDQTIRIAARFAEEVEPRTWGPTGHVLELAKQVGALSACVLIREGYKFGTVPTGKLEDESSDVLFMLFRLGHLLGVPLQLPESAPKPPEKVEPLMLTLVHGTGHLVSLCDQRSDGMRPQEMRPTLDRMVTAVAQVAAYYGFALEAAHRTELKRAKAWLELRRRSRSRPLLRRLFPRSVSLARCLRR